jgi:CheY-like chemotaxis protein
MDTMTTENERILILDDEPALRRMCAKVLARVGYQVREAGSGQEALHLLEEEIPDLLLLDIKMPDMDGLTVLGRARELAPGLVVVIITGHGSQENIAEARRHGARDVLLKPFEPGELLQSVSQALQKVRS